MDRLDHRVQLLLDKMALHELITRLARGVDRCDRELIVSCYHPDAYDDHGAYKGGPEGFADWVIAAVQGNWVQHTCYNELFDVQGDIAYGEIYVSQKMRGPDGGLIPGYGRYIDKYERRGAEWRIAQRQVITEYVPTELGLDIAAFVQGSQDRDDPSYRRA